eukprot:scaffold112615_cov35-Attheya_sp.AAC.1
MFRNATTFNQNIGGWDVSSGVNFRSMFNGAEEFNQNMSSWDLSSNSNAVDLMFRDTAMPCDVTSLLYPEECESNCRNTCSEQ